MRLGTLRDEHLVSTSFFPRHKLDGALRGSERSGKKYGEERLTSYRTYGCGHGAEGLLLRSRAIALDTGVDRATLAADAVRVGATMCSRRSELDSCSLDDGNRDTTYMLSHPATSSRMHVATHPSSCARTLTAKTASTGMNRARTCMMSVTDSDRS